MLFRLLVFLLKRYCEKELDQWENWKLHTKYGEVYLMFSREPESQRFDIEI